jgi:dGTPase
VRDGILNHTGKSLPFTLEGQVVRISDRIAYINHDIDDAIRSRVIRREELPDDCVACLGGSTTERINTLVTDLAENSDGADFISLSEEKSYYMNKLRDFMFVNVYHSHVGKGDEELEKVRNLICSLYDHYMENPKQLPAEFARLTDAYGLAEIVKDHIAGMTDRYAISLYKALFVPDGWKSVLRPPAHPFAK